MAHTHASADIRTARNMARHQDHRAAANWLRKRGYSLDFALWVLLRIGSR